jgi:hypothetical protein
MAFSGPMLMLMLLLPLGGGNNNGRPPCKDCYRNAHCVKKAGDKYRTNNPQKQQEFFKF